MSIPLPPPIGDGFQTSPSSVNYVDVHAKDNLQERTNTGLVHGAPWNPGVILTKDSLEVPLENLIPLTNPRSEPSRPTLLPIFRAPLSADRPLEESLPNFYQELRNSLSPFLQAKLEGNDQTEKGDKDPDVSALDATVNLFASFLGRSEHLKRAVVEKEGMEGTQKMLQSLPSTSLQASLFLGERLEKELAGHLSEIGSNDPSYDLLTRVFGLLQETRQVLYGLV